MFPNRGCFAFLRSLAHTPAIVVDKRQPELLGFARADDIADTKRDTQSPNPNSDASRDQERVPVGNRFSNRIPATPANVDRSGGAAFPSDAAAATNRSDNRGSYSSGDIQSSADVDADGGTNSNC